eukprot:906534-Pyramimonas_sp.AAC.1
MESSPLAQSLMRSCPTSVAMMRCQMQTSISIHWMTQTWQRQTAALAQRAQWGSATPSPTPARATTTTT